MSKRTALIIQTILILVCLGVIYWQWVGVNYDNCLIKHRSGYQLTLDRGTVHEECKKRINPFYL